VAAGFGFGSGACLGGAAAARFTGFGGAAGAARCGKRSGGGGSMPLRSGSAVITFGSDSGGASRRSIEPLRGGNGAALLERIGGASGNADGGRGAWGFLEMGSSSSSTTGAPAR
jgi:hypothetical protein